MVRFFRPLKALAKLLAEIFVTPSITLEQLDGAVRLGSIYGGWTIQAKEPLQNTLVISCGLGEDGSFDAEIANLYGAKVIIVDPTPRAIRHYNNMITRVGLPSDCGYLPGGQQPINSYDLTNVQQDQIEIIPKALWTRAEPVQFFRPENPDHVSHSIKFSGRSGEFMNVDALTINDILRDKKYKFFSILKLDIEGAEIDILNDIDNWVLHPDQILVEFDILRKTGLSSKSAVEEVDRKLRSVGYICFFIEDRNYSYILQR